MYLCYRYSRNRSNISSSLERFSFLSIHFSYNRLNRHSKHQETIFFSVIETYIHLKKCNPSPQNIILPKKREKKKRKSHTTHFQLWKHPTPHIPRYRHTLTYPSQTQRPKAERPKLARASLATGSVCQQNNRFAVTEQRGCREPLMPAWRRAPHARGIQNGGGIL